MKPSILIGLGVLFFLFIPLSIYTSNFPIYGIGLTGAGLTCTLGSLFIKRNSKGFISFSGPPILRTIVFWTYRAFLFGIGLLALYGCTAFWKDLPSYLNNDFSTLEGVPDNIIYEEPKKGNAQGTIIVSINDQRLPLNPTPKYSVKEMNGHYFQIEYLPHTQWIMDYKIKGLDTNQ